MSVSELHWRRLAAGLSQQGGPRISARIASVVGNTLRADLPGAALGDLCEIRDPLGAPCGWAEVIGLDNDGVTFLPYGDLAGVTRQHQVVQGGRDRRAGAGLSLRVGPHLLGAVLDGTGRMLAPPEGSSALAFETEARTGHEKDIMGAAPNPLSRARVSEPLPSGVRAIDALLTLGLGQRIGIFSAAGIGKTSLLGMLLRSAQADVCVIGLIGERGREVKEWLELELSPAARARSVVVVATSDRPAVERRRAAFVATAIAEHFRDEGKRVLLVMDSLTRFARALREIGLAAGEAPARQGYPPSVFAVLPQLLERSGAHSRGSITAIYTVLVEGDDMNEPVADEARSLLDGHIVLSAKLAAAGHFPAIDVLRSVSRVMHRVVDAQHREDARRVRALLAKYQEIEFLVSVGEYQRDQDAAGDEALDRIEAIRAFLKQGLDESGSFASMRNAMSEVLA